MNKNRSISEKWFKQAEYDLGGAKSNKKRANISCFLSRQASEKALKSFLYNKGKRSIITHSISNLIDQAGNIEESVSDLKRIAKFVYKCLYY